MKFIENPSDELLRKLIDYDYGIEVLEYVKNISIDIIKYAIIHDYIALLYVDNITEELIRLTFKTHGEEAKSFYIPDYPEWEKYTKPKSRFKFS